MKNKIGKQERKVILSYVAQERLPFTQFLGQKLMELLTDLQMKKGVPPALLTKAFSPLFEAIRNYRFEGTKIPVEQLYKDALKELITNSHLTGLTSKDVYDLPTLPGMPRAEHIGDFLFQDAPAQQPIRKYKNLKEVLTLLNPREKVITKQIPTLTKEKYQEKLGPVDEATELLTRMRQHKIPKEGK